MSEIDRLLEAIEKLLKAEAAALRGGNVAGALSMHRRVSPVIHRLVEVVGTRGLGPVAPARLAERVHQVRARRRENIDLLAALRAERQEFGARLKQAGERLRQLRPAYGTTRRAASFSAAG